MKIGILLPSIYASKKFHRMIYAPLSLAVSLANQLVDFGHQVFLYTTSDVKTKAKVIAGKNQLIPDFKSKDFIGIRLRRSKDRAFHLIKRYFELNLIRRAIFDAKEHKLDILHSFHDLEYLDHFFDGFVDVPMVYTLHDPLPDKGTYKYFLLNQFADHNYVSISNSQRKNQLKLNYIATVYHGIDLDDFLFWSKPKDYFLFMARIIKEKGLPTAIKTAIATETPLKIGSDITPKVRESNYFKQQIKPFLNNPLINRPIFFDKDKGVKAYQEAKALLFPIEWEEPFGMVMIEAMACGTPVVAFGRGSVPEIIKDGETGFVVDPKAGQEGFIKAAKKILDMPEEKYLTMRQNCRKHVEENFTSEIMAKNYEKVYSKIAKTPPLAGMKR